VTFTRSSVLVGLPTERRPVLESRCRTVSLHWPSVRLAMSPIHCHFRWAMFQAMPTKNTNVNGNQLLFKPTTQPCLTYVECADDFSPQYISIVFICDCCIQMDWFCSQNVWAWSVVSECVPISVLLQVNLRGDVTAALTTLLTDDNAFETRSFRIFSSALNNYTPSYYLFKQLF
jgi:hypothetical protein